MSKDTPFAARTLTVEAGEMRGAQAWSSATAHALLDLLHGQPWGRFTEMQPSVDDEWWPYDQSGAARLFESGHSVGVRREGLPVLNGALHCGENGTVAYVTMQAPDYEAGGGAAAVEDWLARALNAMPAPAEGRANADRDQMMFRRTRKLPLLQAPLSELSWLHVVYPAAYHKYFDRETLLSAPWHRVEERGEAIWMWSYEEPFHYDTPVARESHAALRHYLGERMKRPR